MDVLAQYGYGPSDKLSRGLAEQIIGGVVFSPRYCRPDQVAAKLGELDGEGRFLAMDPEFYATDYLSHPEPNLGALEEWPYFRRRRRSSLVSGEAIPATIESCIRAQEELGLTHLIAPNVYIRRADSIDTAIALNFLDRTKGVASSVSDRPVFGTLAIHRDSLLSGEAFREILDGLTGLENPPDGYYVVVGSSELQSSGGYIRSDLSHPEVIAAWMYANYVLALNGSRVVNGYCFMLGPLMGVCGAGAAASGWSSGLRKFCVERYVRTQTGGRAPNTRYVSIPLMSHVKQVDLDAYQDFGLSVKNGLLTDAAYLDREPTRTEEALQAWDALRSVAADARHRSAGDLLRDLEAFKGRLGGAREMFDELRAAGFSNEIEPNLERLVAMEQGIEMFLQWAELR